MNNMFSKSHISFHTPGHSGEAYKGRDFFSCDITELSYSDNLLNPSSAIATINNEWAANYGADFALCLTGGGTAAIRIALNILKGKCVIVGGAHQSVFNVLKEKGATATIVKNAIALKDYLKKEKADFCVFTYPDYLGQDGGVAEVSTLCKEYSLPLFIDSAHGAHFAFSDKLPVSATQYGDLVAYSLHKTLPVCTGGAVLCGKAKYLLTAMTELKSTHTTSPNYMVIESMRLCLEELKNSAEFYDKLFLSLEYFYKDLSEDSRYRVEKSTDPTRLVIHVDGDACALGKALEEYGIFAEAARGELIVFIITPYNCKYLSYLSLKLKSIKDIPSTTHLSWLTLPQSKTLLFDNRDYELVAPGEAIGRQLYMEIGTYPPAVPAYYYKDVVDEKMLEYINKNKADLFGLVNGNLVVLK